MKKISVITVTRNDINGLKRTIDSIDLLFSSIIDITEHVIIDGLSTDGTNEYLLELANNRDIDTVYVHEADKGIYDAMNKGITKSRGQHIVFLNAGDEVYPKIKIEKLVSDIKNSEKIFEQAGITLSAIIKFKKKTFLVKSRVISKEKPRMPTVHQSIFYKKSVLLKHNFNTSYRICGDYENFAAIYANGFHFKQVEQPFAIFYAGGLSSKRPYLLLKESMTISEKYFHLNMIQKCKSAIRLFTSLLMMQILLLIYKSY